MDNIIIGIRGKYNQMLADFDFADDNALLGESWEDLQNFTNRVDKRSRKH